MNIKFDAELSEEQAHAFAVFLNQAGTQVFRDFAASDEEARLMRDAGLAIKQALTDAGVVPR